eukprot:5943102-Ditylum_brightwellii.AAC.1
MAEDKPILETGNKAAMSAANKLLVLVAVVSQGDKPSTVSNVAKVVTMGTMDIVVATSKKVVATSVATESNVANVGERDVVVTMSKKVGATSAMSVSNVAKVVATGATVEGQAEFSHKALLIYVRTS